MKYLNALVPCSLFTLLLLLTPKFDLVTSRVPGTVRPLSRIRTNSNYYDTSVHSFITERTCWWNEPCKKEFQRVFRCRCPDWAYCQSLGRYYAAHCSFTKTGYIWEQKGSASQANAAMLNNGRSISVNGRSRGKATRKGNKDKNVKQQQQQQLQHPK